MLDNFLREFLAAKGRESGYPHERALQTAHICANAAGEKLKNVISQFDLHCGRLFSQDREARLDVWRLKLSGKSPFKSRNKAVFQICDFRGGEGAGVEEWVVPLEKRIEMGKEI